MGTETSTLILGTRIFLSGDMGLTLACTETLLAAPGGEGRFGVPPLSTGLPVEPTIFLSGDATLIFNGGPIALFGVGPILTRNGGPREYPRMFTMREGKKGVTFFPPSLPGALLRCGGVCTSLTLAGTGLAVFDCMLKTVNSDSKFKHL